MGQKSKNYTENYTDNCPEIDGSKGSHNSTNIRDTTSQTEIEFAATNAWVEFNKKDSDDSESFYKGWELAIKWYTENKNN